MQTNDPNIRWIEEPKLGLAGRMYLPMLLQGLQVTSKHLVGPKMTVSYPEEQPTIGNPLIYRGVHRLNRDDQGRVKCVACFLCATACPAHCIDIIAAESPWPDREKYPESFTIDELRCIFCGMCEEACPVDAIELTSLFDLTGRSREEMIFDKEKLLSVFDRTKQAEPMKSEGLGEDAVNETQTVYLAATLLAAAGVWLLLPGRGTPLRWAGAVLGLAAFGMLAAQVGGMGHWARDSVFWIMACVTVVAAAATISFRSPVYCAVWFALSLMGVAAMFLFERAQFLAVATVVVYAGAILVTFLFVLMLARSRGDAPCDRVSWEGLLSASAGAVLVGILTLTLTGVVQSGDLSPVGQTAQGQAALEQNVLNADHVAKVGAQLFSRYLLAIEVAGLLLLAALVGAAAIVVHSRRGVLQTSDPRALVLEAALANPATPQKVPNA